MIVSFSFVTAQLTHLFLAGLTLLKDMKAICTECGSYVDVINELPCTAIHKCSKMMQEGISVLKLS